MIWLFFILAAVCLLVAIALSRSRLEIDDKPDFYQDNLNPGDGLITTSKDKVRDQ